LIAPTLFSSFNFNNAGSLEFLKYTIGIDKRLSHDNNVYYFDGKHITNPQQSEFEFFCTNYCSSEK